MGLGEPEPRLQAADPLVGPTAVGQGHSARDQGVGDDVHAVERLGKRQRPVGTCDRRARVDVAEHLEAGELSEEVREPRILPEIGELGRRRLHGGERGIEAVPAEQGVGEVPRHPGRAAPVAGGPQEQLGRLAQHLFRIVVEPRGRGGLPGPRPGAPPAPGARRHLQRVAVEPERLLLRAQRDRPLAGRPQRDAGLRGQGVRLGAFAGVAVGREVVGRPARPPAPGRRATRSGAPPPGGAPCGRDGPASSRRPRGRATARTRTGRVRRTAGPCRGRAARGGRARRRRGSSRSARAPRPPPGRPR